MHPEKLYAIIGHPLGHSLSPALHSWAFGAVEHPGIYMAFPQEPGTLESFFNAFRTLPLSGCNITIPFKVDSMNYLDEVSERARRIGAVNTVYWKDGRLCGENTDVLGFAAPLQGMSFERALILGAGGASRAAVVALQELGVKQVAITNRTKEKAQSLAGEFGIDVVAWEDRASFGADLLVNATSLGMKGKAQELSAYPSDGFAGKGLAYDIVYTPERTRFLQDAEAAGWQTQSGIAMFVEQARAAFRIWTGTDMPSEGAYALVRKALRG